MPIVSRVLDKIRPQLGTTVRVRETLTAAKGHVIVHQYLAQSEAQANTDMAARDVTTLLRDADFRDLLAWTQAPAKNDPDAFDLTDRDITLIEGEDFLYKHFAESNGEDAILLAWWLKAMNPPTINVLRDRAGLNVTDGNRVQDRAVSLDDAEATFDDLVEIN